MVHFTISDIERVMSDPDKVRNLSVIAHVDHGKSTLTDSLFAGAGVIRMDQAGNRRITDGRKDEELRCITIKSTGISLLFPKTEYLKNECLVNVIDSPGHVDFSSEVTAALRASDGALVVVDCIEGVCVQTETVLRQALQESIKPVLVINKLDRFFLELNYDAEQIYQRLCRIIESVNAIISTYQNDYSDSISDDDDSYSSNCNFVDFTVDPLKGNVAFTAGLMGWGFTLPQMANFYREKKRNQQSSSSSSSTTTTTTKSDNDNDIIESNILRNLWGDRWVNPKSGKVSKIRKDNSFNRGFNEFIIRPITKIFELCDNNDSLSFNDKNWIELDKFLPRINVSLNKDQRESLKGKELIKLIMQKWIPAHICLLDISINHLPSPKEAQRYRVNSLYTGEMNDEIANSIRNCDPNGPLVIYISKMAPERPDDRNSRFIAFGRVFSGTIKAGSNVNIFGSNYIFGKEKEIFKNINITRVCTLLPKAVTISSVCAGNTVGIIGLDKYILKSATISDLYPIHPIKPMTFSVAPVVQRAVEPLKPSDLPKLSIAIKQLLSGDSLVQCNQSKNGEFIISGAGELHLEICLNDLQNYMGDSKLIFKDPVVSYCESVTRKSKIFLAKSPNKHNRLFISASPLSLNSEIPQNDIIIDDDDDDGDDDTNTKNNILLDILSGDYDISSKKHQTIVKELHDIYGWNVNDTKNLWGFYPNNNNQLSCNSNDGSSDGNNTESTNVFIDSTFGVQFINEIKESISASMNWTTTRGPLIEGELIGVRFDLHDAVLHADSIHRGASQIIPPSRRAIYASYLDAEPRIMEPIYLVEITCPRNVSSQCHAVLGKRRSNVIDESKRIGNGDLIVLKAYLPVAESFGFTQALRSATSGKAFPQMIFHHWEFVPGNPLEDGSFANTIVKRIRESKGLSSTLPKSDDYCDTL